MVRRAQTPCWRHGGMPVVPICASGTRVPYAAVPGCCVVGEQRSAGGVPVIPGCPPLLLPNVPAAHRVADTRSHLHETMPELMTKLQVQGSKILEGQDHGTNRHSI